MTREELEKQIAAVSKDIDILNNKIVEVIELAKERDRLRNKMQELMRQYIGECFREDKVVFAFNGKIKDLLKKLEKERKTHPFSF
ncbi:MAG: hypothetical protein GXW90_00415 [Tepidanaerobacter acetatoxydans]|uniref:hypothetical protein n=1 Tax=Tepidanaerobacter acetatoxydans TaxID=499229 RepID=UPI0026EF9ACA|nr:hypothetical protein [Tepidanaerobacter acetatoxydans]NLU09409.1 hypothetical protein [Tepidanaerobacter acetatoxydans]